MSLSMTTNKYAATVRESTIVDENSRSLFPIYDLLHIENIFIDYEL